MKKILLPLFLSSALCSCAQLRYLQPTANDYAVWHSLSVGNAPGHDTLSVTGALHATLYKGGDTVRMFIDSIDGLPQWLTEWRHGDTSFVIGASPGDVFMRANTTGTDYDVIFNVSDPAGVKIQGKDTATGNAFTILSGSDEIFQGDTLLRVGNNGALQYYNSPCAGCPLGDNGTGTGKVIFQPAAWRALNDSQLIFTYAGDTLLAGIATDIIHTAGFITKNSFILGDLGNNFMYIEQNADGFQFLVGGVEVARFNGATTAGSTRFLIYDVDNGTLEHVTVGAPDSGGSGYKVLRIPN